MRSDVSFVRVKSNFKIAISIFLCFCIIVIPFVQRAHAVVTTTTVVVILILTLLTAMGITLVIADGSKEAFIEQKGDEFMQSKGYTGTFSDWIKGQSDIQIGLKVGFLMLANDVVDRIKEFVSWLIPGASSNITVDLSDSNGDTIDGFTVCDGYVNNNGKFVLESVGTVSSPSTSNQIISANGNILTRVPDGNNVKLTLTGGYYKNTGLPAHLEDQIIRSTGFSYFTLFRLSTLTTYNGKTYYPGIYECTLSKNSSTVSAYDISFGDYYPFALNDIIVETTQAAARIGDYNDLSDLTQTTVTEDGTTTIYNTFYITQDGQALSGTGQDIADIVGALRQALDDLNRRLEVIPQTAATEAEGTVTPDYSDFDLGDLDLSGLGALLTTRFPFSIPWDIIRIFQTFVAEPEAPSWTVDLLPIEQFENVNTEITIDLGQYPLVGQISRYFCIIELCIGLCYITKRLVWTA